MSESTTDSSGLRKPKLLDRARDALRSKYYSLRTEGAYFGWMRRFILSTKKASPRDGRDGGSGVLSDLS